MYTIDEISDALLVAAPDAFDSCEIAAFTESLGITDAHALRLGYSSVFDLAAYIFATEYEGRLPTPRVTDDPTMGQRVLEEVWCLSRKVLIGLAYSLPWILLTVVEIVSPHALDVPAALGSVLTLAIILSLVTTGGFVQAITRDVNFYLGMKEPSAAWSSVWMLLRIGMETTVVLAILGVLVGLYFYLFGTRELMLAAAYYVLFSLLWMVCAVISAQGLSLTLPIVLLGSGAAVFKAHLVWHTQTIGTLLSWPLLALATALVISGLRNRIACGRLQDQSVRMTPSTGIHLYSLVPVFLYGTSYFSFLFLDRLCAGSALPWNSGLSFGVDPIYKHGMDIALFAFLLSAVAVEYITDVFLRQWWAHTKKASPRNVSQIVATLRRRYCVSLCAVAILCTLCLLGAYHYLIPAMQLKRSQELNEIVIVGGAGYLVLVTCLFGNIVLLSINEVHSATRAALLGIITNLLVGYTLSHLISMQFAAVGLFTGSCVFAWHVHRSVWRMLAHPDYYFSLV